MPDEHEQYPMLRALTESAEEIEVPAVIVRELFAERDALVADRDRLLADRPHQLAAMRAERNRLRAVVRILVAERDRLRAVVARYKEFAESEILDRVSAELGVDLRRQLDGSADMGAGTETDEEAGGC